MVDHKQLTFLEIAPEGLNDNYGLQILEHA